MNAQNLAKLLNRVFSTQTQKSKMTILRERGISIEENGVVLRDCCTHCRNIKGLYDGEPRQRCCLRRIVSLLPDFKNEKPLIAQEIEKRGHKCLFLPKFHT